MRKGFFISFEGGEGLGKSTQIQLLARALKKKGYRVLVTREPGGTKVGEMLRKILKEEKMSALAEAFVLEASRVEHVQKLIRPALKKKMVVISDRYQESTLVYQGFVQGAPLKTLKELNRIATGGLKPNVVILLDGRRQRLHGRSTKDKFDQKASSFHAAVRKGFLKLMRLQKNIKKVDADATVQCVHNQVMRILKL